MKSVKRFFQGEARVPGAQYHDIPTDTTQPEQSAAQLQLQELARKQLDTSISLDEHVARHRQFTRGEERHVDVGAEMRGVATIDVHQTMTNERGPGSSLKRKVAKIQPDASIPCSSSSEISAAQTKYSQTKTLTRHEMDLENSLKRLRDPAHSYLDNLITVEPSPYLKHKYPHPEHPMNTINDILKSVGKAKPIGPKSKPDGFESCELRTEAVIADSCDQNVDNVQRYPHNKWTECVTVDEEPKVERPNKEVTEKTVALPDIDPRLLENSVVLTPEMDIIQNRISLEEIKNLPRFKNYTSGVPNKTIYVKNLSPKTTHSDLVSIFFRFHSPATSRPHVRLLTGRMRGQAFVTFHNEDLASEALTFVNGYTLNKRPMVIQYSNPRSPQST